MGVSLTPACAIPRVVDWVTIHRHHRQLAGPLGGDGGQRGLVVAGGGEVVAVADDVGGRGVDPEVGLPHVAQGLGPVMRQATHPGPGVSPVIAQAVEGGQAPTQPLTLLNTPHTTLIRHSLIAFRALHIQSITFRKDKGFTRR